MFNIPDPIARKGFRQARALTRHHAKSFYFASLFLPGNKRYALYSVYSICRMSDDAIDRTRNPDSRVVERLRQRINRAYGDDDIDDPILAAFHYTIRTHHLPRALFDELIAGVEMDLNRKQYKNFDELYAYCYKVAGVVGLMMLHILDADNTSAPRFAVRMGIAMQLTNILRDIREDAQLGRVYLPQDELNRFGLSRDPLTMRPDTAEFQELIKFQIHRARDYYQSASEGIALINDGWGRFLVCLMKNLYAGILEAIEQCDYDVFSKRAYVGIGKKLSIVLRTIWEREYFSPSPRSSN